MLIKMIQPWERSPLEIEILESHEAEIIGEEKRIREEKRNRNIGTAVPPDNNQSRLRRSRNQKPDRGSAPQLITNWRASDIDARDPSTA